ncbi:hypothetical protein [Roseisalinus antarcticus]|uniref:SNARE associated Golgi protein n=1 Tax=Roseisalinus antarcticus TaxID=254357 RepID=A0A1Y5TZZ6_9RHOB|nr:hypothetical protein [Roseisalinus antarcticus]SLN77759.1 hypothetical protein ROA7023_04503 [Roseisalinus antarcticus]
MGNDANPVSLRARCGAFCRVMIRLFAVLLIAYGIHLLMGWVTGLALFEDDRLRVGMLVAFLLAYGLLISVPFVPGVEIGLSLMVMEGPWIAPLIYGSTVAGLSLAYAVGEWVPYARLHRVFDDLRLKKACRLLEAVQPLSRTERLEALRARAPVWLRPLATRYRYVLLGPLVNLPGNAVLGGGGGILFTAGLSRLFLPVQTVVTILVAVAPVPLAVWLFDIDLGAFLD